MTFIDLLKWTKLSCTRHVILYDESLPRRNDDVIGPTHEIDVAVLIHVAPVSQEVVAAPEYRRGSLWVILGGGGGGQKSENHCKTVFVHFVVVIVDEFGTSVKF